MGPKFGRFHSGGEVESLHLNWFKPVIMS